MQVDLGRVLTDTFADYKADFLTHLVASALCALLGSLGFGLLVGPLQVGYMRMEARRTGGAQIGVGDVFKGFEDFIPALVAFIVSAIIVSIGFLLCVLPGLLLMPIVPVAFYLVAHGEKDGVNAVRRAWACVRPNLLMAVISMLVLSILGSLGTLLCGVGVVLTLPILYIGAYHLARQLAAGEPGALQTAQISQA